MYPGCNHLVYEWWCLPFFAKITVMLVYENNFEQQQKIDARWGTKMTKKDKYFLKILGSFCERQNCLNYIDLMYQ